MRTVPAFVDVAIATGDAATADGNLGGSLDPSHNYVTRDGRRSHCYSRTTPPLAEEGRLIGL